MEQDPIQRHKDVLAHTIAVIEKTSPDRTLRLAALFHDVGKPLTRSIGPGGVHFHHHDVVGAKMARKRMTELRYPSEVIDDVAQLVRSTSGSTPTRWVGPIRPYADTPMTPARCWIALTS